MARFAYEAQTEEEMKAVFDDCGANAIWPYASKHVIDSILMTVTEYDVSEDCFELGESKIGGYPHLPESIDWDKIRYECDEGKEIHLSFILQLNLEEVSKYDKSDLLPKKGMFYFFAISGDWYVNDFAEGHRRREGSTTNDTYRAIYVENPTKLKIAYPDFKPTEEECIFYESTKPEGFNPSSPKPFYQDRLFHTSKLKFSSIKSFPCPNSLLEEYEGAEPALPEFGDDIWLNYEERVMVRLDGKFYEKKIIGNYTEILGYGRPIYNYDTQTGVMSHGRDDTNYHLFFQLWSHHGMDWFNNSGSHDITISKSDLLNRNFDNVSVDGYP